MTTDREATSNVQLSEDVSHVAELPPGVDFMEVNGAVVMGESQGNDLCLQATVWHVGGGRQGKWMVDDTIMGQTTFVMVPQAQRGRMQDNDFIANRQNPTEWLRDIQIVQKPDRIIWQCGNRQHISRPPYWEIKGEHMGVECNLTMGGLDNASHVYGPWSDLVTSGRAGYSQRCWVEGTITVGGKAYVLEKGYGIHDMMTFGETWDHRETMRVPYYWISGMSESIQIFMWTQPGAGIGYGRVYMDGQEIPFDQGEISMDELELWTDPRTVMRVPVRWHVNMNSSGGIVDMNMASGGRSLFCIQTRTGFTMRYMNIACANGRVFLPNGRSIQIQDMMTYVEWGMAPVPLEGGADLPG